MKLVTIATVLMTVALAGCSTTSAPMPPAKTVAPREAPVPDTAESPLPAFEERIRAIYERDQFRPVWFRGEWLPDGSGYIVTEEEEGREPKRFIYTVSDGTRRLLAPEAEPKPFDPLAAPDGKRRIDIDGGDLWVRGVESTRRKRLTTNAKPDLVENDTVRWSPDSARIAFVENDYSRVRLRSMLEPVDPSYPEVTQRRFARVGGDIAALRVGVVSATKGKPKWLDLGMPDEGFYLGQIEWASNPDELLIETMSRFRDERSFHLANVSTGEITRIYHETDPAWTVASYGKNAGLQWIRGGEAFVVLSEREGWRRAYVHARDGKLITTLTPGDFDIIQRGPIDEARNLLYFYASPDDATQRYLYRVDLDGSDTPERVTPSDSPGWHYYHMSPDRMWAFHTVSRFDEPPVTSLVRMADHQSMRVLENNAPLRARVESLLAHPTEFIQLEIAGGITLDAWMLKPRDFDPAKKYPVLVYVYGEPHAQTVLDGWDLSGHTEFHRAVADLGYLVVSIDNRGTPAPKGAAWRRSIFPSLGPLSTEEQAAGLRALARDRPYVDMDRVGIWGWSGGGSNTLNALFRKPEIYRVGIAVAPKPQPHLYNAWFQEIYMETRKTNPEGYEQAAPINFAEGLEGDLLIIHGSGERNTHIQIVEGLVDRLIELGKEFDYMVYPNRSHGIYEGPGTTVHVRLLIARYLLDHLSPGPMPRD